MKLTIQQKIELARKHAGISQSELAKAMGTTQGALWQRLQTGKFSDADFELMATALGAEYYSGFKFPDDYKIGD